MFAQRRLSDRVYWSVAIWGILCAPIWAQEVRATSVEHHGARVSVWEYPFLAKDELSLLRLLQSREDALKLFFLARARYGAMAASPGDGVLDNGAPVASAVAISGSKSISDARETALEACDKARKSDDPCVILVEISPL